ncbi:MAG: benzoyl-CoA 2,3-epoxidase subunit BoxB [Deltaproteobacteria bacterium]|nr:benzoyl-CoA 2,3-epoxidase subunit BoxB [Deltaproteobacteria bacterium]
MAGPSAPVLTNEKIPNNVDLSSDRRLQRALEKWQPEYIKWWKDMGPEGFQEKDVYLRTAISVDIDGWANFGHVKMPDYRWGIFLTPQEEGKKIGFGDNIGKDVWQEVPGEHRNSLRRLIVTQGDTEPASVEQQRLLGETCPSLYDLRNLFQVNVEEGRHLWAMVYLLHSHFGSDGREEADELLERRSGNADHPRILNTFNEPIDDWISFFMFTMFTDRDGKYQLAALAESAFDPLARTCKFMLTEEAHHMFVGQTGVNRIVRRACELMNEFGTDDVGKHGGFSLALIQKYINFWFSSSVDLFGNEKSSNAASYFSNGLKGRAFEQRNYDDHVCKDTFYSLPTLQGDKIVDEEVPTRNAMNEILRDAYIIDNQNGVNMWNREVKAAGIDFEFSLPSRYFNRTLGQWSEIRATPEGSLITEAEWDKKKYNWIPSPQDKAFVKTLMKQVIEPGKMAAWISPPNKGINEQETGFDYVKM